MRALKRGVFVILGGVMVFCWNSFALAGEKSDANLVQENRKQLIETHNCPGCDLSGVNLDRVNLTGANLEGANLEQARLRLATLAKANLRNSNLKGAMFGGADLAEADLRGANLKGATFVGAYLVGTKVDNESLLHPSSTDQVAEDIPAEETKNPNASAQDVLRTPSVIEKNGNQTDSATKNQTSAISKSIDPPSSSDPGFFDKTLKSVQGFFGQAEDDTQKSNKADERGKSEKAREELPPVVQAQSEKDIVATKAQVKNDQPSEVIEHKEVTPSIEQGFFDKTIESVKGMFGQGEGDSEAVTKKSEKVTQEISPAVQTESAKNVVVDSGPVKDNDITAAKEINKDDPSDSVGFIDKTMESVKGLFGQNESDSSGAVAVPSNETKKSSVAVPLSTVETAAAGKASAEKSDSTKETEKNKQRLLDTKRCYGCSLIGVDLIGQKLSEVDLEGADLTGARLEGADLEKANLKGAVLVGVDLRNANLKATDLYKANLTEADLTGAKLENTLLDDAQLSNIKGYDRK